MRRVVIVVLLVLGLLAACGESQETVEEFAAACHELPELNRDSDLETWGDYVEMADAITATYEEMLVPDELRDYRDIWVSFAEAIKRTAAGKDADATILFLDLWHVFALLGQQHEGVEAALPDNVRQTLIEGGCLSEDADA